MRNRRREAAPTARWTRTRRRPPRRSLKHRLSHLRRRRPLRRCRPRSRVPGGRQPVGRSPVWRSRTLRFRLGARRALRFDRPNPALASRAAIGPHHRHNRASPGRVRRRPVPSPCNPNLALLSRRASHGLRTGNQPAGNPRKGPRRSLGKPGPASLRGSPLSRRTLGEPRLDNPTRGARPSHRPPHPGVGRPRSRAGGPSRAALQ